MTPRAAGRTRPEPRSNAILFWRKAQQFAAASRRDLEAGGFDPCVSAAIHAVIAASDAVCVHYLGERNAGEHGDALRLLRTVDEFASAERQRVEEHLARLLGMKNLAEYEARGADAGDARTACRHMERALKAVEALARQNRWA